MTGSLTHVCPLLVAHIATVVKTAAMLYALAKNNISAHRRFVAQNVWLAASVCQTRLV